MAALILSMIALCLISLVFAVALSRSAASGDRTAAEEYYGLTLGALARRRADRRLYQRRRVSHPRVPDRRRADRRGHQRRRDSTPSDVRVGEQLTLWTGPHAQ